MIRDGLVSAVGGVVAMVPEGLILLTSVAFTVGVVRLAKRRTLVQELPAIEVLARVDVICLDKTGTITSGAMDVAERRAVDGAEPRRAGTIDDALAALAWSDPNPNATQQALQDAYRRQPGWTMTRFRRLLVRPEVERVLVRRAGHVDLRRARRWCSLGDAFDAIESRRCRKRPTSGKPRAAPRATATSR